MKIDGIDRVGIKYLYSNVHLSEVHCMVFPLFHTSVISALDVELNAKWEFYSSCKSSLNNGNNGKKDFFSQLKLLRTFSIHVNHQF